MDYLRRLGNDISVPIPPDEDGFTGRECPQCEGYFKIEFGTGLQGEDLPCHCPYCGHIADHDHFWTKEQIEYATSIAVRKITNAFYKELKRLEFHYKPKGEFGIGLSMKVERGRLMPIHYYREKQLETEIVCANCTLRYSVYGVFGFCPDCGQHNSLQILTKNLEVVVKMLDMAAGAEKELAEKLIENALEDCVSAFDGFGRELCRIYAKKAEEPDEAVKINFQNLEGAKMNVLVQFGVDLSASVSPVEWTSAVRGFQKRHLFAHKMGVVDQDYLSKTNDPNAVIGRKIAIDMSDVQEVVQFVQKVAQYFHEKMTKVSDSAEKEK